MQIQINTIICIIENDIEIIYFHYLIMLFKTHLMVAVDEIKSFKYVVVFFPLNIS